MKTFGWICAGFIGVVALVAIVLGGNYALTRWYDPQIESNKREAYKETASYVDGNIEEMRKMRVSFENAEPDRKQGLANAILSSFSDFPREKLPSDLVKFMEELEAVAAGK